MSKKFKVVQLVTALPMGGAEALVKDYALHIDKSLFDITVIVARFSLGTANEKLLESAGINVLYASEYINRFPKFVPQTIKKLIRKLLEIPLVYKLLIGENPDAIHMHLGEFTLGYNNVAVKYAQKKRIPCFFTVHNEPQIWFNRNFRFRCDKKYLMKHREVRLIALHDAMKEELNQMFSVNNTVTIRNAINLERFKNPRVSKSEMRSRLSIPSDAYVIGHVGRMEYQKNHETIINIFAEMVKIKPNSHLLLVGSGTLEGEIRRSLIDYGIQERTTILSNRDDISDIMSAMDVFLLPSRYEGLGIVLIEAQAVGLRCVVSNAVPAGAFVTDRIIAVGLDESARAWCDAILSDEKGEAVGGSLDDYDMRTVIKQLETLYANG